jgi:hypothetical protein
MRKFVSSAFGVVVLAWSASPAGAQTILGYKLDFKEKPGFPATRRLVIKSKETLSAESLAGDPIANGAAVHLIVNGATSTSQTIILPGGADRWRRSPSNPLSPVTRWRYRDSRRLGYVSPLLGLEITSGGVGSTFKITADFRGKYVPLNVALPNPGTYAGMSILLGGVGSYCTNFGGTAGGTFANNDAVRLRIARPTAEGTCPSGTPVCGDNVVDSPFETCDGTNDGACPGLCGSNGLPCLCPFCGDGTIDPGESCDTQSNLGSCIEGCSYTCACSVCGNGTVETPAESCEPSGPPDTCGDGVSCGSLGNPDQCQCPYCGDNYVNGTDQCDGTDDSACLGSGCRGNCTCAVCGDDLAEGTEECDGTDDGDCPLACQVDCTCP